MHAIYLSLSLPISNVSPTIIYCTTEFVFPIRTLYALLKSVGWNRALGDTAVGDIRRDKLGNENQVNLSINIQNQIHLDHSPSSGEASERGDQVADAGALGGAEAGHAADGRPGPAGKSWFIKIQT